MHSQHTTHAHAHTPHGVQRAHDPSVRKALLTIAAACHNPAPLPQVSDWAALRSAAHAHRLMPLAHTLLADSNCPEELKQASRRDITMLTAFAMAQEREQARALAALAAAGVETIVMKGPR